MSGIHRVYLIPGFFGFASIGRMRYFDHVHRALHEALGAQASTSNIEFQLHDVTTAPTSSLEERARRLASTVLETSGADDELHFVGHSTGGLDARWALDPTWTWNDDWSHRVDQARSVVSLASPHHGAPLARFFASAKGEAWLRLLSAATVQLVRLGPAAVSPIGTFLRGGEFVGGFAGSSVGLLETVRSQVIDGFDRQRGQQLEAFFAEVRRDRSLLSQLQPRVAREIDLRVQGRPGVRYGSVLVRAAGRLAGQRHAGSTLFEFLHERARWQREDGPPPELEPWQRQAIERWWATGISTADTDAIVPTLSQVHGDVVSVVEADHLDVLGFFDAPSLRPPHKDWLRAPPAFTPAQFQQLWDRVGAWLLQA